jgi:hypothetical protein
MNIEKKLYIKNKQSKRDKKRTEKRNVTGEEVIYIFEKVLEGWKTIKIFNTILQTNSASNVSKKLVETISTGNCKVCENELSNERYYYYLELRNKVYNFHKISLLRTEEQRIHTNSHN